MSCSEQSPFHGQAVDRVWSFPNYTFKLNSERRGEKKQIHWKQYTGSRLPENTAYTFRPNEDTIN